MSRTLEIGGVGAEGLARRFGSPLYVYSREALERRFDRLAAAFERPGTLLCYALKANSNGAVCRVLARRGAGADVVSGGELRRALAAGFSPSKLLFSGVGKTREELELALRAGVMAINVESAEELEALSRAARCLNKTARVSVRVNPGVRPDTHPHVVTGGAGSKFGVAPDEALALLAEAARGPRTRAVGLQCHIGSQILDPRPFERAAAVMARALRAAAGRGVRLELADFGGGLGVPYRGEAELPLARLARALEGALAPWPDIRLVVEPGRYLTADAGFLLTTVLYRKIAGRRRLLVVDAGMNDLLRPALYGAHHAIAVAKTRPGARQAVDVVGPVCESADVLGRARALPPCEPGDVLVVLGAGAYGFSMGSQYNSRPRPAEVLVESGRARLVRRRETWRDLIRHER